MRNEELLSEQSTDHKRESEYGEDNAIPETRKASLVKLRREKRSHGRVREVNSKASMHKNSGPHFCVFLFSKLVVNLIRFAFLY